MTGEGGGGGGEERVPSSRTSVLILYKITRDWRLMWAVAQLPECAKSMSQFPSDLEVLLDIPDQYTPAN